MPQAVDYSGIIVAVLVAIAVLLVVGLVVAFRWGMNTLPRWVDYIAIAVALLFLLGLLLLFFWGALFGIQVPPAGFLYGHLLCTCVHKYTPLTAMAAR